MAYGNIDITVLVSLYAGWDVNMSASLLCLCGKRTISVDSLWVV